MVGSESEGSHCCVGRMSGSHHLSRCEWISPSVRIVSLKQLFSISEKNVMADSKELLRFCFILVKSVTETNVILKTAYGEAA